MKLAIALALPILAFSQQSRLTGPTPGFLYDTESRSLRPVRGFAGSAHLGAALIASADAAAVSADGTLAVASRNGAVELTRAFDTESPVTVALGIVSPDAQFAWSGHDLAVVAARKASIYRSLDSQAEPSATLDLSGLDAAPSAIAFDGQNLFLAAKGGLYRANAAGFSRLVELADPSAIALRAGVEFVADRATGNIWRVTGDDAALFAQVDGAVGLQLTSANLLVASSASRSVEAVDLASGERAGSLALDFQPERLEILGAGPLAVLNRASATEPLWVLDSRDALQVFFVPTGSVE